MAIDPITGLETINDVVIPDVGIGDAQGALQGRVEEETDKLADKAADFGDTQPDYVPPDPASVDTIKDPSTYQRPEDMVSYQMGQLLNQDSEYMKANVRRSEEKAQRYGQLGSSMAVGAGTRAAIESALPIAQQDAQTSSKYGLQGQAAENQIGQIEAETEFGAQLMKQRTALEMQQQSLDQAFKLASAGLDAETQLKVADIQGRWSLVTNDANLRLEAALKEKLNIQQIDAETVASVRGASSDLIQNYQISVEELLKDPEFLGLGGTAIQNTLNNMLTTTTSSIQFLADSSGINLDSYLDIFEADAAFTTAL
jgi:hypothetical protein